MTAEAPDLVPMAPADVVRVRNMLAAIVSAATSPAISDEELAAFIRTCERADVIGPFMDPTAWVTGHDRLAAMTDHARALGRFRSSVRIASAAEADIRPPETHRTGCPVHGNTVVMGCPTCEDGRW